MRASMAACQGHRPVRFGWHGGPNPSLLIVAGSFTTAGGLTANHIAAWNPVTSTWSTLGTGFNGDVNALVVWDPDGARPAPPRLIAGGSFTTAGGVAAAPGQWDGLQWQGFEGGGALAPVYSSRRGSILSCPAPTRPSSWAGHSRRSARARSSRTSHPGPMASRSGAASLGGSTARCTRSHRPTSMGPTRATST